MVMHGFMRFPKSIPQHLRNVYNSKLSNLCKREIEVPRAIDWGTLASLGIDHDVRYHLTKSLVSDEEIVFISLAWENIFNLKEILYKELICEFYATVRFDQECTDYLQENTFKFRLGGEERSCSIMELSWRCGMFSKDVATMKECLWYNEDQPREPRNTHDWNEQWKKIGYDTTRKMSIHDIRTTTYIH